MTCLTLCRYPRVNSPSLSKLDSQSEAAPVEMVTVPAMGPEWRKDEMLDMRKATHRQERAERRAQRWKEWKRGERGLCGRYFTRKFTVWFLFFLVVAYVLPSPFPSRSPPRRVCIRC